MKISSAKYWGSAANLQGLPRSELPEVGFAGRSNVGKSSLINCLVGIKRLCHTSSTPGRTRCLNFYLINSSFYFVDFPGYGYAKVSKEMRESFRGMIEPYLLSRRQLRGVFLILDGRHQPMSSDLMLKDWLIDKGISFWVVLTKMDKVPRGEWAELRRSAAHILGLAEGIVLSFSAASEMGKKDIWRAIQGLLDLPSGEKRSSGPLRPAGRTELGETG
jgi:GTP-binding protein